MKHPLSNSNTKLQLILCAFVSLCLCVETSHAAQYSKFGIVTAAKESGKWEVLKKWIDEAGYADEWLAVEYLSDDYPEFAAITNAVVATGIATAEEVAAIISAARDTAPDALLGAMYEREMQTPAGRQRWHGKGTTYTDTTNWVYVTIYEDGYRHVEPKPGLTPAQKAAAKTNALTKGVSRRLAAARLKHIEEATQTNVVDVVLQPDGDPLEPIGDYTGEGETRE